MQTYWDLTEQERAELTEEQVEGYLKYELMAKGVLKPICPEEEPLEAPVLDKIRLYCIKEGWNNETNMMFATESDADAAIRMGLYRRHTEWHSNTSLEWAEPVASPSIVPVSLMTKASYDLHRNVLTANAAAMERNAKRREEYETAVKAANEASEDIWSNWHKVCGAKRNYARLMATYEEYVGLSGDSEIAGKFLMKAFSGDDITKAFEWHEKPLPTCISVEAADGGEGESDAG